MNDPSKLFRVLVLGGALLGTGCVTEDPPALDAAAPVDDAAAMADAAPESDAAPLTADGSASDAATPDLDGAAPSELCFCPGDGTCCETNAAGASVPRAGIECCWSTSC